MGSNTINKLPEGFVLDQPELPEGFVLDARPPLDPAEEERQIKDTVGMSESTGISVSHVNSNYKEMQGKSKPPVWRNVAAGYGALPKTKSGEFLADARREVRSSLDNIQSSHDLADAVMGGQGVVEAYEKWDKQQERAQFRAEVIETSGPVKSIILKNIATAAPMLKSLYEASPFAFGGAVVGMGIATIVGAGAPAPEELLTVPAAGKIGAKAGFAIGAKLGMTASTAEFWYRQGLGDFYGEMIKSGADPKIAKIVAPIAAIPYAAIEYAQISQFTPGLRMGAQQVIARSVTKVLADAGRQYGKTLMQEALFEEVLQESVNIAAVDLANYFSGNDIKFDKEAFLDRANRLMVTGLESLKSMALLPGPNAAVDIATGVKQSVPSGAKTVEEIAKNYDKRIEKAKTPVQEQALKELKAFEEEQLVEPEAKTVEKAADAPAKPPKPAEATVAEGKGEGFVTSEHRHKKTGKLGGIHKTMEGVDPETGEKRTLRLVFKPDGSLSSVEVIHPDGSSVETSLGNFFGDKNNNMEGARKLTLDDDLSNPEIQAEVLKRVDALFAKPTPAEATVAEGKQPWEMTREEYHRYNAESIIADYESGGKESRGFGASEIIKPMSEAEKADIRADTEFSDRNRRSTIEAALRDDKPVPPEVLAEYKGEP